MAKKSNRESITIGQSVVAARRVTGNGKLVGVALVTPAELAQIREEQLQRDNRARFAELIEGETEAANAAADRKDIVAASGLYGMQVCPECDGATQTGYTCPTCKGAQVVERSADPGSVVGLDGFTPDSDTPKNGDPARTDPDPS